MATGCEVFVKYIGCSTFVVPCGQGCALLQRALGGLSVSQDEKAVFFPQRPGEMCVTQPFWGGESRG